MKKLNNIGCITMIMIIGLSGCAPSKKEAVSNKYIIEAKALSDSSLVNDISTADNKLAFKFLKASIDLHSNDNIAVSPLSLSAILALTQNGAANKTKEEMLNALELGGLSDNVINESYKNLISHFNSLKGLNLKVANSIWIPKNFDIKKEFIDTGANYYEAESNKVVFGNKEAGNKINKWVSEHTNGKIKKIEENFHSDIMLLLINTLYFKGDWYKQFEKANTSKGEFTTPAKTITNVDMMKTDFNFEYLKGNKFEAVRLPYSNKDFGMYVFLPDKKSSVKEFINSFSYDNWKKYISSFKDTELIVKLPKFKVEYEQELNDMLKKLGMKSAFENADFSKLSSEELYISKVKQKCFVEVNETGTEATAATEVQFQRISMVNGDTKQFTADRPFVYVIADNKTGMILFMGTVEKP